MRSRVTPWRLKLGEAESWWDGWVVLLSLVMTSGSDKTQITLVTPGVPKLCAFHTHTHTHTHTHMLPQSQQRLVTRIFVQFIKKSLLTLDVIFRTSKSFFLIFLPSSNTEHMVCVQLCARCERFCKGRKAQAWPLGTRGQKGLQECSRKRAEPHSETGTLGSNPRQILCTSCWDNLAVFMGQGS